MGNDQAPPFVEPCLAFFEGLESFASSEVEEEGDVVILPSDCEDPEET